MVEGRLKRHIARVGRREVFRQGKGIYPVLESPSPPAEPRQVARSGQPGQKLAGVSVLTSKYAAASDVWNTGIPIFKSRAWTSTSLMTVLPQAPR